MHRNFFLFKRQVSELKKHIINHTIKDCFSHRKDEIVLHLEAESQYFLRIRVHHAMPYFLLYSPQNINTPRVRFFEKLYGSKILNLLILPFDKEIRIICDKFNVQCTFFGKMPNCVLYETGDKLVGYFKSYGIPKTEPKPGIQIIDPWYTSDEQFQRFMNEHNNLTLENVIRSHVGGFNSLLARELIFRCNISPDTKIDLLNQNDLGTLLFKLNEMINEAEKSPPGVYMQNNYPSRISVIRLFHLERDFDRTEFNSVNEAWKYYINYFQVSRRFEQLRSSSEQAVKKRITFLKNTLSHIREGEELEAKKKLAELKGNLLLTHAQQIQRGQNQVTLENIITGDPETISIKLNPAWSISENAQHYFNKFKDMERTKAQLRIRKRTYASELREYERMAQQLQNVKSIKDLIKINQMLTESRSVQKPDGKKDLRESFRHALLEQDWEVFVGKNARNNDRLTFYFAGKYDMWFHAQGVSGSHVILRRKNKHENPPENILEQTAQIAAFYSTAKHNAVVPVIYTEVRYVRKPRKADPGMVVASNTTTVFVEPKNLI